MRLEYDFLVAASASQCVVLPQKENEELHLIDLDFRPKILLQSPNKFLILFDTGEVIVYNYNGLRLYSFHLPSTSETDKENKECLFADKSGKHITKDHISMSNSQIAVLDTSTARSVFLSSVLIVF